MQKEQISTELVFKEYPSIQLSTRDKFIQKLKQQGHGKPDILWVASQKIHGCNFSVHYDGNKKLARYGRRTDFLSKQIPVPCQNPGQFFIENFYDSRNTVKKFHNSLEHIFNNIKSIYHEVLFIQIYGEYFGGNWPPKHPNFIQGPKAVQKGVYYTPNHEFMVFDIKVTTPTSIFWVDVLDIPKYLDDKMMCIPIFAKGNFEQIYKIDTVIDSTIPQLLGYPRLQKNIIEGMVLRPNKNLSNKYYERIILKKKNQQFLQKSSEPKIINIKKDKQMNPQIILYLQKLSIYLNKNRIQSIISKFPNLKDRNKIKIQLCKDIYIDTQKDQFKWTEDQDVNKKIKTEFQKVVIKEINSYYISH